MNPEVDQIISSVEQTLQKLKIITASFQEIKDGKRNPMRICIFFLIHFGLFVHVLRYIVCAIIDDSSPWNYYLLNYYLGFGILGKFLASIYISGFGLMNANGLTILFLEWKAKLTPLTDLRDMLSRFKNPSQEEVKQFTFFLKLVPYIGVVDSLE